MKFLLAGGGDGGSSGGGVWVSGRNEGFAIVRMTCSDVAFRAATASSCVTFSKLLSFTCTYKCNNHTSRKGNFIIVKL